jgi:hypothetical protein
MYASFQGSILSGTPLVLTVSSVTAPGIIQIGQIITFSGSTGTITVVSQSSGTTGGAGAYVITNTGSVNSGATAVAMTASPGVGQAVTSTSLVDVNGFNFFAEANKVYQFEAIIFHDCSVSMTKGFAVTFAAGTGRYMIEQTATATTAPAVSADSVSASYKSVGSASGNNNYARITGTYYHTAATAVKIQAQVSTGTMTIHQASFFKWTKLS